MVSFIRENKEVNAHRVLEVTRFTKEQFYKVQSLGISDSQLYKMAGNAVTVNVAQAIAKNLLKFNRVK